MSTDTDQGSWWKTLPGVLSGIAAVITAVAALIVGLKQVGVLGPPSAAASVAGAASAKPQPDAQAVNPVTPDSPPSNKAAATAVEAPPAPAPAATAPAAGEVLAALREANVVNSVGDAAVLQWLADADRHYLRVAEGCLRLLADRRLTRGGADLDKINAEYMRRIGLTEDDILRPDQTVDVPKLTAAVLAAYNNKNGTNATALPSITAQRGK